MTMTFECVKLYHKLQANNKTLLIFNVHQQNRKIKSFIFNQVN